MAFEDAASHLTGATSITPSLLGDGRGGLVEHYLGHWAARDTHHDERATRMADVHPQVPPIPDIRSHATLRGPANPLPWPLPRLVASVKLASMAIRERLPWFHPFTPHSYRDVLVQQSSRTRWLILDFAEVTGLDATAAR